MHKKKMCKLGLICFIGIQNIGIGAYNPPITVFSCVAIYSLFALCLLITLILIVIIIELLLELPIK